MCAWSVRTWLLDASPRRCTIRTGKLQHTKRNEINDTDFDVGARPVQHRLLQATAVTAAAPRCGVVVVAATLEAVVEVLAVDTATENCVMMPRVESRMSPGLEFDLDDDKLWKFRRED
jgi:hypothetical protein